MYFKQISMTNYRMISFVDLQLDKGVITVAGKNGNGKSSLFDGIELLIAGNTTLGRQPVKQGKDEAIISGVTDTGLKLTKTIKSNRMVSLKIEQDGERIHKTAPQQALNNALKILTFDPMEFDRMKPKEQRDVILSMVTLDVDLDQLAKDRKSLCEERALINKQLKAAKVLLEQVVEPAEEELIPELVISELIENRDKKFHSNTARESIEFLLKQLDMDESGLKEEVDRLTSELKTAKDDLKKKSADIKKEKKKLSDHPAIYDMDALNAEISNAEEKNKVIRLVHSRKADFETKSQVVADTTKEYEVKDAEIVKIDETKEKALKSANIPIPKMTIDDEGLLVDGVPLEQECKSKRIKISVTIGIKVRRPAPEGLEFKIMLIRDGNDIDDENMYVFDKLAKKYGYQLYIERIRGGAGTVLLENGIAVNN